jgi:hypothetical protein
MKQKDIAMIIAVVFVSGIISFIVSGKLFVASNGKQKVETVDTISPDFATPDSQYFNKNSIDPTQLIHIGNGTNPNPFNPQNTQ